jgi:CPA2 family monovalent cation:H+ antiporter-2
VADHGFMIDLGIALVLALAGGLLARAVRLPPLLGYLIAGIVLGPHTPGVFARPEPVRHVAQLGVALLMFAVGAHFSLAEFLRMRRVALQGGGLQIGGTILLGLGAGALLGWGLFGGLFLGCAMALSSTAVSMKLLEERGELGTPHGGIMLVILVAQDLSLVLMVALLPAIASLSQGSAGALPALAWAVVRAALFIAATLFLATRVVPAVLHAVVRTESRELFLLAIVCLCLATATAAEYAGLGLELGAFIAGLMVSETEYAHHVISEVRPLRDVFAALFFVSIGMLLDPAFVLRHAGAVALVAFCILAGKALISMLAVYSLGTHGRTALFAGFGLAQIGEFSFVLASIGSARGLIPAEVSSVILSAALVTLLAAPFVFEAARPAYNALNRTRLSPWLNHSPAAAVEPDMEATPRRNHVIVIGGGRVGRLVAESLEADGIDYVIIDLSRAAAEKRGENGREAHSVVYGDATSAAVLDLAGAREAAAAVVALPEHEVAEMAVRALRQRAPEIAVIARAHSARNAERLTEAGATAVVYAESETARRLIHETLARL